jgi:S1-C subfamily serine protease
VDEFLSEVESHRPGDQIQVDIIRDGKPVSVTMKLQ